jgi:hypothetical protein
MFEAVDLVLAPPDARTAGPLLVHAWFGKTPRRHVLDIRLHRDRGVFLRPPGDLAADEFLEALWAAYRLEPAGLQVGIADSVPFDIARIDTSLTRRNAAGTIAGHFNREPDGQWTVLTIALTPPASLVPRPRGVPPDDPPRLFLAMNVSTGEGALVPDDASDPDVGLVVFARFLALLRERDAPR